MSTHILTGGGFVKVYPLPSQDRENAKFKLYHLKDLTSEKVARAKAALEQLLKENGKYQYTYEDVLAKFEEEVKQKPYLLKEGAKLHLLEGGEAEHDGVPSHAIKLSQKASYLFQNTVTVGRNFIIGSNAYIANATIVIQANTVEKTNKPLNTSPLEILKNVYRHDPFIQRFSGKALPLEESYINLQIVQEEEQEQKEKKLNQAPKRGASKEEKKLFSHSPHLMTFEEIYTAKKPIKIKDLFISRTNETHQDPLRRLVLGKAGIGKSTFCKCTSYMWAQGKLWNDLFDWLFWIPLRELNGADEKSLLDFIYYRWFSTHITKKSDFKKCWEKEIAPSKKVLLLLDGYDELTSDQLIKKFLSNNTSYHVLTTSRPYSAGGLRGYQRLEITGFTNENIEQFVGHCFKSAPSTTMNSSIKTSTTIFSGKMSPNLKESLLQFLYQNPAIYGIAHIPIQLDLLCTIWQGPEFSEKLTKIPSLTMTILYHNLEIFLLKKYLHLENEDIMEKPLRARAADLMTFLSRLAFSTMKEESLIFSKKVINDAELTIDGKGSEEYKNGFLPEAKKLGLLQETIDKTGYYFLHLTFQEYYAACHLVSLLKSTKTKTEAFRFIREEKYNRRMQIVFWFAAGLCGLEKNNTNSSSSSSPTSSLIHLFFQAISTAPQDLLGIYDAQLSVRLLEEAGLPETEEARKLRGKIDRWVIPQANDDDGWPFDLLAPFLVLSPHYTREYCFPKYFQPLQKGDKEDKIRACRGLHQLKASDERVIKELLSLIQVSNTDQYTKRAACKALGALKVPEPQLKEAVSALLQLIQASTADQYTKRAACKALGALKLPELQVKGAISVLLQLIQFSETDPDIKLAVRHMLGSLKVPESQVKDVISVLLQIVQGTDQDDIKLAVRKALRSLKMPELQMKEAVSALLQLIQASDTDAEVKSAACKALVVLKVPELQVKDVISALLQFVQAPKADLNIKWEACWALGGLKVPKPQIKEVVSALLQLIQAPETNSDIKLAACQGLGSLKVPESQVKEVVSAFLQLIQASCTDKYIKMPVCGLMGSLKVANPQTKDIISALLQLIQSSDPEVKKIACYALGDFEMPELQVEEVVSALLQLIQSSDIDPEVKRAACQGLGTLRAPEQQMKEIVSAFLQLIQASDTDPEVKTAACWVLGDLEVPEQQMKEVVNMLLQLVQASNTDPKVKRAAYRGLGTLRAPEPQVEEVVSMFLQLIKAPTTNWHIKQDACKALGDLKMPETQMQKVVSLFLQLIQASDTDPGVKSAAYWGLETLKIPDTQIKEVVGVLMRLIQAPDIRQGESIAACEVLGSLKAPGQKEKLRFALQGIQAPDTSLAFPFLLQEKRLDSIDSSQFRFLVGCGIPEEFTIRWAGASLSLSRFLADCFKHQFFEKECIEITIRLALEEQSTLYLDQGKLYLYHRKGRELFPKEGTCSDACLQFINCLKETWEHSAQKEKHTFNEALVTTTATTRTTTITTTTSTTVNTLATTTTLSTAHSSVLQPSLDSANSEQESLLKKVEKDVCNLM